MRRSIGHHRKAVYLVLLILLAAFLAGCSLLPAPAPPTPFPDLALTVAAQTIAADLTRNAPPTATPIPSEPLAPTATPTPLPTNTPFSVDLPSPTLPVPPSETPKPKILFQDDFSGDTGWFTDRDEDKGFEFTRDGYLISVNILKAPIWSIREREMSSVRIEVDGTILSGAEDGYYGVVCRHLDSDNYYALVVSGDGSYGIAKSDAGMYSFVATGQAPETVLARGRNATNRVRGECVGDKITLYANDQELLAIQDPDFEIGYTGVIAGTRLSGPISVLFDNFVIYKP